VANSGTIWLVDFYGKKSPKVQLGNDGVPTSISFLGKNVLAQHLISSFHEKS
jgi:hypothetical protein